jgi:uncharacterized phage protein (TIGR02216 family)
MRTGLGLLHLSPTVLWSMTPREFAAAVEGALGPQAAQGPIDRRALDDLIARYPDIQE